MKRGLLHHILVICCLGFSGNALLAAAAELLTPIDTVMHKAPELAKQALQFFERNSLGKACHSFTYDASWRTHGFNVVVFDEQGVCYAGDASPTDVWTDFYDEIQRGSEFHGLIRRTDGIFIAEMLKVGPMGGWVSYQWKNGSYMAYVYTAVKNGVRYAIGVSFSPLSAPFIARSMVEEVSTLITQFGIADVVSRVSNPTGEFVRGSISVRIFDADKAIIYADGRLASIVAQELLDYTDQNGLRIYDAAIELVKRKGAGWQDHFISGLRRRAYYQGAIDKVTQKLFIVSAEYFPDVDADTVRQTVQNAVNHLRSVGKAEALRDFSNPHSSINRGPLKVFVYDTEGVMLADAENPNFVGQNLIRSRESVDGRFVTKRIIDKALDFGAGWVTFRSKNAYKDVYVERVVTPEGTFVVGAGYWPMSKEHATYTLCVNAAEHLKKNGIVKTCHDILQGDDNFLRGDLFVSVYDEEGICYVAGPYRERIWQQDLQKRDKQGVRIMNHVSAVARGGGWITYPVNGSEMRMYALEVYLDGNNMPERPNDRTPDLLINKQQRYIVTVGYFI